MKQVSKDTEKIKQFVYGKHVLISSFIMYPAMLSMSLFYIIIGFVKNIEPLFFRIFYFTFGLCMLGLSIWVIYGIIKYRAVTANLLIDQNGIAYKSKDKYYLSWEQIHRIEINIFNFNSKQMPKPYIVFYTNYGNQK